MNAPLQPSIVAPATTNRDRIYGEHIREISRRTDRLFAALIVCEWLGAIAVPLVLSRETWSGVESSVHPHVWAAFLLGALITVVPAWLGRTRPGEPLTRHVMGVGQMLMAGLLVHITGGRIETHFIVFGSLAFLAFYRDWRVIVTASVVVLADHVVRGAWWPESIYGVAVESSWRWLEHGFWVAFEDVFLIVSCVQSRREMRAIAERHALSVERLQEAVIAAEQASRAKSAFLANMSHEIRTPLTGVLGYADLLFEGDVDASSRLNYVQTIRRNGEHLLSVINDVLDLAKIEAGMMTMERVECSPAQLLLEVASLMRVRATESGLGLVVRFASAVPALVRTDPTRLRQILMNLVGNAIKFTERGSVTLVVRYEREPKPRLSFGVIDTGIGIERAAVERLFQPFTQADSSTTRRYGGTGLGLGICRELAEMLGGSITIESEVGRGSAFTVTIDPGPLDGVPMLEGLEESSIVGTVYTPAEPARCLAGARILLAEDGVDNQRLLSAHLRKAGADVRIADNGLVALEQVEAARANGKPFDLVLMDMQMPELDGYSATAKLRRRGFDVPVIALTAHAMASDRARCIAAGCDEYLTKPIRRDDLLAALSRFVKPRGEIPAVLVSEFADDEDMAELVAEFVEGMPERIAALRAAHDQRDAMQLRRLSHQLKGSAGGYGFSALSEAAGRLEHAVGGPSAGDRVDELVMLCGRARARAGTERQEAA